jgi:hypothetical protein
MSIIDPIFIKDPKCHAMQHTVLCLVFCTFGGFGPEAVKLSMGWRNMLYVDNKLTSSQPAEPQYEGTTWSARSWVAFQYPDAEALGQAPACGFVAGGNGAQPRARGLPSEGWLGSAGRRVSGQRGGASRAGMMRRVHAARRSTLRPYVTSAPWSMAYFVILHFANI